nr:uncharacterized protein LOC128700282 isoform X4 [Cherax quadricarinatus]
MKLTHQALAEKPMTFIKSSSASEETHYEKLDARPSNVSTNKSASQFLYGVNKRLSPERQSIEKQSSESQSTVDKYKNALKQNSKKVASASISDNNVIQSGRGIGVMNGRTARGSMNTHNNSTSHQQSSGMDTQTVGSSQPLYPTVASIEVMNDQAASGSMNTDNNSAPHQQSSETDTQTLGPSQQLNPMVTNIEVIINGQTASGSMNTDNNSALNQQRPVQPNIQFCENNDPLSGFVIVQRTYTSCDSAFSKLKDSSKFSCLPVKSFWSNKTACTVVVNGVNVATAQGDNKKAAREAAAVKALEFLSHRCYTLKVLKIHASEEEVSVEYATSGTTQDTGVQSLNVSLDKPVDDNSLGSKLLKMMGWTGGGLGKEGSGITEPISSLGACGRQGLGHQKDSSVTPHFRSRMHGIIQHFSQESRVEDLAFSPGFSNEQRHEILKIAHQHKLKCASYGTKEDKYIVVSRKLSAKQLISTLIEEGPTDKYQLIPPLRVCEEKSITVNS